LEFTLPSNSLKFLNPRAIMTSQQRVPGSFIKLQEKSSLEISSLGVINKLISFSFFS
jgi:hypothetical protein